MEIKATQKFVITSPRKLREVAILVKGMSPTDAVVKLPYVQKRAVEPLRKVIITAIANAKQIKINEEDLVFKEIQINQGPQLKRWRAGARGRAKPYKKRMSHIRVVLETREPRKRVTKGIKKKRVKEKEETRSRVVGKTKSTKAKSTLKSLKIITSRRTSKKKGEK